MYTQHDQQVTTSIARSPYKLTLRRIASTCETRSDTGHLPSFQRRVLAVIPNGLERKMSRLLTMDFNKGRPNWTWS